MLAKALTKARIYQLENMSVYTELQFNPGAFKDSIGVNWTEIAGAGMSYPLKQYAGGKTRNLTFQIFLNDIERPGILRQTINFLHGFLPPAAKEGYQFVAPPAMLFSFGWFVKPCLLEAMEIEYNYFSPDLQPLMCTVDVALSIIQ